MHSACRICWIRLSSTVSDQGRDKAEDRFSHYHTHHFCCSAVLLKYQAEIFLLELPLYYDNMDIQIWIRLSSTISDQGRDKAEDRFSHYHTHHFCCSAVLLKYQAEIFLLELPLYYDNMDIQIFQMIFY